MPTSPEYLTSYAEVEKKDLDLVGGKNLSVALLSQQAAKLKINVPEGFIITTRAFEAYFRKNNLAKKISEILSKTNKNELRQLLTQAKKIQTLIKKTALPTDLIDEITTAYVELAALYKTEAVEVAVRSSATTEDLAQLSAAGQYESFLNVSGVQELITACQACYASLFNARAIAYRQQLGVAEDETKLAIGVQKMIRADQRGVAGQKDVVSQKGVAGQRGAAGVMFTLDPKSGDKNVIRISAAQGLGEKIVKGEVTPNEYLIKKNNLSKIESSWIQQKNPVLTKAELTQLAIQGLRVEKFYRQGMDIEWAKDGLDGKIYLLQARPVTTL